MDSRKRLLALAVFAGVWCGWHSGVLNAAEDPKPLFKYVNEATTELKPEQDRLLKRLRKEKSASSVTVVNIAASDFQADELTFNLAPPQSDQKVDLAIRKLKLSKGDAPTDFTWVGDAKDGPTSIKMAVQGKSVRGIIPTKRYVYEVRPLGDGLHALIQRDASKVQEHPPAFDEKVKQAKNKPAAKKDAAADLPPQKSVPAKDVVKGSATTTINVMVLYTPAVKAGHLDVASFIQQDLIGRSNDAFADSRLDVRFSLAHAAEVNYVESGEMKTDVDRLVSPNDTFIDAAHALRDTHKADVVVLLVENGDAAGLAAEIKATKDEAFCVMDDQYAWYYTFAHEIGHLMGCWHNPEAHSVTNPYYAHGHGFRSANGWRTIMAYNCNADCIRVGLWSSPELQYPAGTGGTPAGTQAQHDNRRVWMERAIEVAAFR